MTANLDNDQDYLVTPNRTARTTNLRECNGTWTEHSKKILAEYAPEIMARRQTTGSGLKPTTIAAYTRYVEQDIVPSRLGEMPLTDIRRSHVNTWIADLSNAGHGAVTVRRALATLRMIFSAAVREEIIPANRALMVDKPAVTDHHVTPGSRRTPPHSWSVADATGWERCSN